MSKPWAKPTFAYYATRVRQIPRWVGRLVVRSIKLILCLMILLAMLWTALLLWVHLDGYVAAQYIAVAVIGVSGMVTVIIAVYRHHYWQRWLTGYAIFWLVPAVWFLNLTPKQDRQWQAEVQYSVSFSQSETNPNLFTLHNVRDFDWRRPNALKSLLQPSQPYFYKVGTDANANTSAQPRWTERQVDLRKLNGVDIVNSYWMGKPVGHTLLSFRFKDERPLSFSFEIRKEEDERFSVFGGFVRQFEIALIAAEERDIIYTRSHARGEQVYLFPIRGLTQPQIQALFMQYMQAAAQLQQQAKWYNTVFTNCTTLIFDFAQQVSGERMIWDYRILASGYVPEYLYDRGFLESASSNPLIQQTQWTMDDWYQHAHINPKTSGFTAADNQSGHRYSYLIRQGLPQPPVVGLSD